MFCLRHVVCNLQYTKRSMRQMQRAGETLFVDFAGPTLSLVNGSHSHLFVAALGISHYTYAGRCRAARRRTSGSPV